MSVYFSTTATDGNSDFIVNGNLFPLSYRPENQSFPNFSCEYVCDQDAYISEYTLVCGNNLYQKNFNNMKHPIGVVGNRLIVFKNPLALQYTTIDMYKLYTSEFNTTLVFWDEIIPFDLITRLDFSSPKALFESMSVILF